MEPTRELGGDLYDFFRTEDGRLCFLVGDVSNKGMPAALFMARAKSLIRITAQLMRSPDGASSSPADIVTRVNREPCQDNSDMMFVRLFFVMFTPESGEVEFCDEGQIALYRLKNGRAGGGRYGHHFRRPSQRGLHAGQLSLSPGEGIYVFTDGVTEANNTAEEMFGEVRLEDVRRARRGCRSAEIVTSVAAAVRGFVGAALLFDDIYPAGSPSA
jgi:phosphoserine phosphatase RsbU/P